MQDDYKQDCARCGKRQHSFFEDPVSDLLSYICEPRPWCKKVVAIAHNAKAFDVQIILERAIFLKWTPKLILNGLKIVSMKIHYIKFLDSVSYMPMPLRKLPDAFGLQASKSWFPHLFKTKANLDYVGRYRTSSITVLTRCRRARGGNSWPGIMSRNSRSSTIGTC